jgi:hypothetical protein
VGAVRGWLATGRVAGGTGRVYDQGDKKMRIRLRRPTTCVTTLVVLTCVTGTRADFTPLHAPSAGEADHHSIFEAFFSPGTEWYATGWRTDAYGNLVDLTNGTLAATRVDDWGCAGILDARSPLSGEVDDQSWTGQSLTCTAVARYAGYTQEFGYDLDGDDMSGSQMNVSGSATLELGPGETIRWMRDGDGGGQWSSRAADNADELDHLVAYYVSGVGDDLTHWMLCWEDLPGGGDADYNDMVVEVSARVPEPGTGVTIVLVCGALLLLRRCAL